LFSLAALAPLSATADAPVAKAPAAREEACLAPEYTRASRFPGGEGAMKLDAWKKRAPHAEAISIPSSADGTEQRAFFYAPKTTAPRPLLIVLHSWSTDWRQNLGIPYAVFAERNDWVFVHPDFRGPYRRPEAAASDLVAEDILDAVEYAKKHANVDTSRIYLAGFSGGGMTALAMAGRRPELWAGIVAWAPVWDIPDWYEYNTTNFPKRHYARNIASVCGGAPAPGTEAFRACRERSPSALLERARQAGVPVYIGVGASDDIVPTEHAVRAFDQLANPDERLPEHACRDLAKVRESVPRASARAFDRAGTRLLLERTSGNATLAVFRGAHDIVYDPGLAWLRAQKRTQAEGATGRPATPAP
jgi:predicted esterase